MSSAAAVQRTLAADCDGSDRDEHDPVSDMHDSVMMLVQDWLQSSNLRLTLRCFIDEHRQLGKRLPSPGKWYSIAAQLRSTTNNEVRETAYRHKQDRALDLEQSLPQTQSPLLESVVRIALSANHRDATHRYEHQQQQQHPPPTVLVSKRVMQVRELKFVTKRSLSNAASAPVLCDLPSTASGRSNSAKRATGLRPQSAAVCNSTVDLIARNILGSGQMFAADQASPLKPSNRATSDRNNFFAANSKSRPISAFVPSRRSIASLHTLPEPPSASPQTSPTFAPRKLLKPEHTVESSQTSRVSVAALPFVLDDKLAQHLSLLETSGGGGGGDNGETEATRLAAEPTTPVLDLEEMTEERLVAQFASLDKMAIKKLRRVLAKSSACTQEFEKAKRTVDKIQAKTKLRQSWRAQAAADQTQLLDNAMDGVNREPCSLCQYSFLKTNLVMKVSYKSLLDLQRSWATHAQQQRNACDRDTSSPTSPATGYEVTNQTLVCASDSCGGNVVSRAQQAHLYDEVPICAFCAQLVLDSSSYRPSTAMLRAKTADSKRQDAERHRQRDAVRVHERTRCDPLDFDSSLLNSDDDSDVEEFVEIDADGRPHVVKRRRQKTGRVPAQLGLVSKRLHYDQLRSRTLPSLNNKEWQIIG